MSRQNANLYTQFCIGVELGDDTLVRDLVQQGADTMITYSVDGKMTTPMRSALCKGDLSMIIALLNSRKTRVSLADLDKAPRVKKELVTPLLIRRLSGALEDGAADTLLQRCAILTSNPNRRMKQKTTPLSDILAEYLKTREMSSNYDEEEDDTSSTAAVSGDEVSSANEEEASINLSSECGEDQQGTRSSISDGENEPVSP